MGVAVAIRRPRNPVGWLMLFAGLWFGLQSFAVEYATIGIFGHPGPTILPGALFAAWLWKVGQLPAFGLCFLMLLLFPTGRLPGPSWRLPALVFVATFAAVGIGGAFGPDPVYLDWRHGFVVPNLFSARGPIAGVLRILADSWVYLMPLGIVLSTGSVVFRFAVAQGEQRQQLKWVVCAVSVIGVTMAITATTAQWRSQGKLSGGGEPGNRCGHAEQDRRMRLLEAERSQ